MVVRNIAELRRCGLKLRMPTFVENTSAFPLMKGLVVDVIWGKSKKGKRKKMGKCKRKR